MGSGVGAKNKNTAELKNDKIIEEKYGIKADKLYEFNGGIYCNLARETNKMSSDILKAMERFNNFSRDIEEDQVDNSKNNKK